MGRVWDKAIANRQKRMGIAVLIETASMRVDEPVDAELCMVHRITPRLN
jgi:hypothetical protein